MDDDRICIGASASRGCYCSHLCSYLTQPAWCDRESAGAELAERLDNGSAVLRLQHGTQAKALYALALEQFEEPPKQFVVEERDDVVVARLSTDLSDPVID